MYSQIKWLQNSSPGQEALASAHGRTNHPLFSCNFFPAIFHFFPPYSRPKVHRAPQVNSSAGLCWYSGTRRKRLTAVSCTIAGLLSASSEDHCFTQAVICEELL